MTEVHTMHVVNLSGVAVVRQRSRGRISNRQATLDQCNYTVCRSVCLCVVPSQRWPVTLVDERTRQAKISALSTCQALPLPTLAIDARSPLLSPSSLSLSVLLFMAVCACVCCLAANQRCCLLAGWLSSAEGVLHSPCIMLSFDRQLALTAMASRWLGIEWSEQQLYVCLRQVNSA